MADEKVEKSIVSVPVEIEEIKVETVPFILLNKRGQVKMTTHFRLLLITP